MNDIQQMKLKELFKISIFTYAGGQNNPVQ